MNPLQLAKQMQHLLCSARWPTGAGDLVFGERGATVFAGAPTEKQMEARLPHCLIGIDAAEHDPDHPDLLTQRFSVHVVQSVVGDPMGEFAVAGGSITNLGKSAGRGVDEIAERVRAILGELTGADGAKILLWGTFSGPPATLGETGRHVVSRELGYTALCTSSLHYSAPQRLKNTSGVWTWTGSHCSARFDFLRFRLVNKVGVSASTGPGDGTTIYLGTAATFTAAATTGRTYTVFAEYLARRPPNVLVATAAADGASDPVRGTYRLVT